MNDKIKCLEEIAEKSHHGRRFVATINEMFSRGLYDNPSARDFKFGYSALLQFDFEKYVKNVKKKPQVVLDIGCGMAKFLSDLKKVEPSIEVFGVDQAFWESHISDNHYIVGKFTDRQEITNFLDTLPESAVDLIVSVYGVGPEKGEVSRTLFTQINKLLSKCGIAKLRISESCWYSEAFLDCLLMGMGVEQVKIDHLGFGPYRVVTIKGENWSYPS